MNESYSFTNLLKSNRVVVLSQANGFNLQMNYQSLLWSWKVAECSLVDNLMAKKPKFLCYQVLKKSLRFYYGVDTCQGLHSVFTFPTDVRAGMEEVETAAADTTSEHSSPRYHAHSYEPGHVTQPTCSMTTQRTLPDHQPPWEASHLHVVQGDRTDTKRPRTEGFGAQGLQMSPKTSVHVRRHHGDRPVGIAQPIQLQDTQQGESLLLREDAELHKFKPSSGLQQHSSMANPLNLSTQVQVSAKSKHSSDTFGDHGTSGTHDSVTPQERTASISYPEEVYDSDQSQEIQRFDKFINESNKGSRMPDKLARREIRLGSSQDSTTSETSSESTGRFTALYVTPNMGLLDSDAYIDSSTTQSDVKSQDSPLHSHRGSGLIPGTSGDPFSAQGSDFVQQEMHPSTLSRDSVRGSKSTSSSRLLSSQSLEGKEM